MTLKHVFIFRYHSTVNALYNVKMCNILCEDYCCYYTTYRVLLLLILFPWLLILRSCHHILYCIMNIFTRTTSSNVNNSSMIVINCVPNIKMTLSFSSNLHYLFAVHLINTVYLFIITSIFNLHKVSVGLSVCLCCCKSWCWKWSTYNRTRAAGVSGPANDKRTCPPVMYCGINAQTNTVAATVQEKWDPLTLKLQAPKCDLECDQVSVMGQHLHDPDLEVTGWFCRPRGEKENVLHTLWDGRRLEIELWWIWQKKNKTNTISLLDECKKIKKLHFIQRHLHMFWCVPGTARLKALLFITLSAVNLNWFGILVLLRQWCTVKAFFNLSQCGPAGTKSAQRLSMTAETLFPSRPSFSAPPHPSQKPPFPLCNWNCSYFHLCSRLFLQLRFDSTSECETLYIWELRNTLINANGMSAVK